MQSFSIIFARSVHIFKYEQSCFNCKLKFLLVDFFLSPLLKMMLKQEPSISNVVESLLQARDEVCC